MATIEELEEQVKAQGEVVKAAKAADKTSDETKAAIAKLLEIKKAITALNPDHPQAIKKKEKKKKKKKSGDKPALTKKQLRMIEREKKLKAAAEEKAKKASEATTYGETGVIMSKSVSGRSWINIQDLNKNISGQKVLVRGRVHSVRAQSKNVFFTLRATTFTVQAILTKSDSATKDMLQFAGAIPRESIVDVEGVVTTVKDTIKSATQGDVEINISSIFVVSNFDISNSFPLKQLSFSSRAFSRAPIWIHEK